MTKRRLLSLSLFLCAVATAVMLWRLGAMEAVGEPTRPPEADAPGRDVPSRAGASAFSTGLAVPVRGARVRRDTLFRWIEAEGSADARRATVLRADVEGDVRAVEVREGQRVSAGRLVVRLDSTPYALELRVREADHQKAVAEFRSLLLGGDGLDLTEEEREARRRHVRARSGLARAEVELEKARRELQGTRIRAPFTGRVAGLAASPGDRLTPGDSVATILDLSRVEVRVGVLEEEAPHLAPGRRARVTFTALPGEAFTGRVATVNPVVDRSSGRVRVTVRLDNPEARILPGMHAVVEIAGRRHPDRILVPREAVVERGRRSVVFLFVPGDPGGGAGRAEWRYVETGLESERFVEVVPAEEGGEVPRAGEVVLVEGHATLAHDAPVRLTNADRLAPP